MLDVVFCHAVGDYILQQDFIAKTKGENWYHLFIHCILYVLPFRYMYGADWRLAVLFVTHMIIDAFKARYKIIGYAYDQIFHYIIAVALYFVYATIT